MTAVSQWNPAWGPDPRESRARSSWCKVWCPRVECVNAEGFLVYAPVASDGRAPAEKYACAICGRSMRQELVDARRA